MNHYLSNIDLRSEIPHGFNEITFGAGCFWGVERKFYELEKIWSELIPKEKIII